MKRQAGSSRFDTMLKMLLIAFISLLAFSSGVFFGRVMAENDSQLKALESDFEDKGDHASEKHADYDKHETDALADEDVEALADKYIKNEKEEHGDVVAEKDGSHDSHGKHAKSEEAGELKKVDRKTAAHGGGHGEAPKGHGEKVAAEKAHAPEKSHAPEKARGGDAHTEKAVAKKDSAHGAAPARNVASANAHKPIVKSQPHDSEGEIEAAPHGKASKPDISAVQEAAHRVANNHSPSEEPKAPKGSRVPSSLPKTVGSATETEYTVQVASYPSLDEAKRHATDLVKKGFPAYPVEANVKGKTWFRVSVGGFKTKKEAGDYRVDLMKQANLSSAIVQKIER